MYGRLVMHDKMKEAIEPGCRGATQPGSRAWRLLVAPVTGGVVILFGSAVGPFLVAAAIYVVPASGPSTLVSGPLVGGLALATFAASFVLGGIIARLVASRGNAEGALGIATAALVLVIHLVVERYGLTIHIGPVSPQHEYRGELIIDLTPVATLAKWSFAAAMAYLGDVWASRRRYPVNAQQEQKQAIRHGTRPQ